MNKINQTLAVLAVSLLLSTSLAPYAKAVNEATEDTWTTLEPMPTARSGLGVAVVDGKIYAIGGGNGTYLSTNEMYDPATNTWTTKQSMSTPRSGFGIAVYQNKIYVIGGSYRENTYGQSGFTGVNEVYDPSTDTWETVEPMPTARAQLDANVVGDKIYLIEGMKHSDVFPFSQIPAVTEVYDPATDSWSTKTPIPTTTFGYTSAVIENKIYLLGDPLPDSSRTQIYDTETDKWASGTSVPSEVYFSAGGATSGVLAPKRIYVFGGSYGSNIAANFNQVYDPETDTWATGTPMPTPRWSLGVAVVNDEFYVIGGYSGETYLAVNEKYTPADYIPEFPSWMPILFALVVLAVTLAVFRRRLSKI